MSIEVKEKIDKLCSTVAEMQKANDKRLAELEKKGSSDAVLNDHVQKANDAIDKMQEEIKSLQVAMQRPGQSGEHGQKGLIEEYKGQFRKWMAKGVEFTPNTELKSMSRDEDPNGGYLVDDETASEIVTRIFESSPIRQLASVQTISGRSLEMFEDVDELDFEWVGERQVRNETGTPQINKIVIPVHEMAAQPAATQLLLDDAMVNLEQWLSSKVQDKFRRGEATAFVSGDGKNKPKGFLSYEATAGAAYEFEKIRQLDATGTAGTIDNADDLVNLSYELKAEYKANATWLMKRDTERAVRLLKQDNKYIWQPSYAERGPSTVLGMPVVQADDMPALASDALSVALGDFRRGYQIVDRMGIRVIRDIYTRKGQVLFYTTKRVGGGVKDFDAIKLLKIN